MFCYIYGDFFTLFVPGRIENLIKGNSGAGSTTPLTLLGYAIMLSLPPFMIFLSLVLKASLSRILNIITGIFFTVVMILVLSMSIGEWMIFYIYLGVIEIIMTSTIVFLAVRWPKIEKE